MAIATTIALMAAAGCGGTDDTVLLVTVDKRAGVWPIDRLSVTVDNAGESKQHEFSLADQTFPVTFTVSANGRDGAVTLAMRASDGDGLLRATAAASVDLVVDDTVAVAALLEPTDFVVNSSVAGEQRMTFNAEESGRQLAVSPSGSFMVVFEDDCGPLFRCDMFARLFGGNGRPAINDTAQSDDAFIANLASDSILVAPSIAAGSDGYVMTWEGSDGIDAVAFTTTGTHLLSTELDVSNASAGLPYAGHVSALANGEFVVVWIDTDTSNGSAVVMGRLVDASGVPVVNAVSGDALPFRISTGVNVAISGPVVAATGTGRGFVVVWRGDTDLRARFFDGAGSPSTGTEVSLMSYPSGARLLAPHVTWHEGTAVVSWGVVDATAGGWPAGALLVAGFQGPSGSRSTTILVVENEVPGFDDFTASAPTVVPHAGQLAMAWHSCAPSRSDGDGCAVRHQLLRSSLLPVGEPELSPSTTTGDQTTPSMGSLGSSVVIAWTDASATEPDTSGLAVRARLLYPVTDPIDGRRGARCGRPGDGACQGGLVCLADAQSTASCHDECDTTSSTPQCLRGGLCTRQGSVDGCLF